MRSVRELKTQVQQEAGVTLGFSSLSRAHSEFWGKLNQLGWDRKTKEPEECDDCDATAFLSDDEYAALVSEFRKFHNPTGVSA